MPKQITNTFVVDGKGVQVTRKDGTPMDARQLVKLLANKTDVLVAWSEKVDAESLKNIDDKTLVVRVTFPVAAPVAPARPEPAPGLLPPPPPVGAELCTCRPCSPPAPRRRTEWSSCW